MHSFATAVLSEIQRLKGVVGIRALEQLAFLGEDNLQNASAVKNLMQMGKRHMYVYYGSKSGLERVLPGVRTWVLGPPTLNQSKAIRRQRAKDPDEFWHLQAAFWEIQAALGRRFTARGVSPFPRAASYAERPPSTRWFIPRMDALRGDQLLEIVRILDKAMNNTSVILLFEVGDKRFLFPGDAQIENWSYALKTAPDRKRILKLLGDVNFYKVGHHGSLNATPKTLWSLFRNKSDKKNAARLRTVVSTLSGKHGSAQKGTEVPRKKLVDELKRYSAFFTTQDLKVRALRKDVTIPI
jgi:hypothetical protein